MGSKPQGDSYMKTTYRIKCARDQMKNAQQEAASCIEAIKKYYTGHKYVTDCQIQMYEQDDCLAIAVLVFLTPDVVGFRAFGESTDRMEFIEQLA